MIAFECYTKYNTHQSSKNKLKTNMFFENCSRSFYPLIWQEQIR